MLAVLIPAAIVLPIVLYPVSYTAWQALDIAMRPVTVDDFELVELLDEPSDRLADLTPGVRGRMLVRTVVRQLHWCHSAPTPLSHPLRTVGSIEFTRPRTESETPQ